MPGPQENAAGTTSVSSPIGVVLSFAMAGPQYVTNTVLRNALKFTTAPMILAFDGGGKSLWCGTYGKTELWLYRNHRDRVRINPQVSQLTGPGVLAAHWSNLDFCEQAGMPCADAGSDAIKFVLLEASLTTWFVSVNVLVMRTACAIDHDHEKGRQQWHMPYNMISNVFAPKVHFLGYSYDYAPRTRNTVKRKRRVGIAAARIHHPIRWHARARFTNKLVEAEERNAQVHFIQDVENR